MSNGLFHKAYLRLNRNRLDQQGEPFRKNEVNLIYWKKRVNLGDALAPVILDWMLERKGLSTDCATRKTYALATVGSIVDLGRFDSVVWGSGLQSFEAVVNVSKAKYKKLDIRAVRGPFTRQALQTCGYSCPEVYGDPGILLPMIYQPQSKEKTDKTILISHYASEEPNAHDYGEQLEMLDIKTADYKGFIDKLCTAKKVISSSLHGIILAEAYGIPAVFLMKQHQTKEILKYYDWYYSTQRFSVSVALSMEEALAMEPMALPENLDSLRDGLIQAFPYDLWGNV